MFKNGKKCLMFDAKQGSQTTKKEKNNGNFNLISK